MHQENELYSLGVCNYYLSFLLLLSSSGLFILLFFFPLYKLKAKFIHISPFIPLPLKRALLACFAVSFIFPFLFISLIVCLSCLAYVLCLSFFNIFYPFTSLLHSSSAFMLSFISCCCSFPFFAFSFIFPFS